MTTAPLPTLAAHYSLGTQRRATGIQFLFNGALFASWASEVPRIKVALGLSELELGAALLALMIGTSCPSCWAMP